ncbi:MAG TPA: WD40 repeat domain-containing protein, partial [Gemmataceae bacterium]|nr:WD40 repeat domain-containing protein [Gemmataceae bacterium]
PLGDRLPSASLWEMATGKERGRFAGHRADVNSVAFAPDGRTLVSGSGDTTALVWDVTGLQNQEGESQGRIVNPSPAQQDGDWRDLAGEDAARAFKAIWALTATPRETLALIQERLRPVSPVDSPRLEALVKSLDSDRYATREKATRELEKLAELAEPVLRSALNRKPSLETRQRLESLLQKLDPSRDPERLRSLRAIEVLEHIGSAEAQTLLQQLARGAPAARLTQEAKASCVRLLNRPANVR